MYRPVSCKTCGSVLVKKQGRIPRAHRSARQKIVVDVVDAAKQFRVGVVWGKDCEDEGCNHRKYDDRVHVGADESRLHAHAQVKSNKCYKP